MATPDEQDLWLFGYGSLIWKPPPHFDKRVPGFIEGYVRRFWQSSEDHRGTPDAPGRVVTLIPRAHWESLVDQHPQAPSRVWGAAYRIPAVHVREVKEQLDIREINGYSVDFAAFHVPVHVPGISASSPSTIATQTTSQDISQSSTTDSTGANSSAPAAPITCLVYIGLPDNPQFLGPQDMDALARHVVRSRGPSGENSEYVYKLAEAMEELKKEAGLGAEVEVDEHVADLAEKVRREEVVLRDGGGR